jgi:hypothetical protein
MKHILPTETINKILNLLTTRPYGEVVGLIAEINKLAVLWEDPANKPPQPVVAPTPAQPAVAPTPANTSEGIPKGK